MPLARHRLLLVLLFITFPAFAKPLVHKTHLGNQHGLEVTAFTVTGPGRYVGADISVKMVVRNTARHAVRIGRYGIFIGARDPQDNNRDFGHAYRNQILRPGQKVVVTGKLRIDKPGTWTLWPAFHFAKYGWGKYQWHAIKLKVAHRSVVYPPYASCKGWHKAPSLGKGSFARHWCNRKTGYIGLQIGAFAGAATAEAMHYFTFHSKRKQKVRIRARFAYIGGATTTGYGSFAGFQAVHRYGKHYGRKDIKAGIDVEVVTEKIIDLALLALPEVTEAKNVKQALDYLDLINNFRTLASTFNDLVQAKKARTYTYTFTIHARKDSNTVGVGLRGGASGVGGSGFVIIGAQLQEVAVEY